LTVKKKHVIIYKNEATGGIMSKKRRISYSQLTKWLFCQRQWFYNYIMKLRGPRGSALVVGSVWHAAIEYYYLFKKENGYLPAWGYILDYYNDTFEKQCTESVIFNEGETPETLRKVGERALKLHYDTIAPTVDPLEIEFNFEVELDNAILNGVIDLIDSKRFIHDNKLVKQAYSQNKIDAAQGDKGLQLTIYALVYRIITGEIEGGLLFDMVQKKENVKGEMKILQRGTTRTEDDLWLANKTVNKIAVDIDIAVEQYNESGDETIFEQASSSEFLCDPKWCNNYNICRCGEKTPLPF
jgi:hypothetical protein